MSHLENELEQFTVVVNAEEQYALWPAWRPVPDGWTATEVSGSKSECTDYVERVWIDMRPRSLREQE